MTEALTGTRIRDRRQMLGLRQADLALKAGISASYLNLIEHNRRRIGGKLVLRIARLLDIEPAQLTEGAEATLISALREAEAAANLSGVEMDRIEEFAGRFPGWAALLAATFAKVGEVERKVESLNDRLAHDPVLADSIHEVLSTTASIRSTASILVETDALEPEWLDRFHANINEDSARLADSSRALAGYLDQDARAGEGSLSPTEEVDRYLEARDWHFTELETGEATLEDVVAASDLGIPARSVLHAILDIYCADVASLPLDRMSGALQKLGASDPAALARELGAPVALVMRRLAGMPEAGVGFVMCDRSGSLLVRKALPGFALPRFGASCPLWPLFEAFAQPGTVLFRDVEQLGRRQVKFDCFAIAEPVGNAPYNSAPLMRASMMILPSASPGAANFKVGAACRICPRTPCRARREPSVLGLNP